MNKNIERDQIINEILGGMQHNVNYVFSDKFVEAVYMVKPKIERYQRSGLIQDIMIEEDLIYHATDAVSEKGMVVRITVKGLRIKEAGGWIRHNRIQNLKNIALTWIVPLLTL